VCADLQKEKLNLSNDDYNNLINSVDMVINAAASVKHYGSYKYFYEANVETTKHLIEFCKTSNSKLIHISTLSVSGNGFGDDFDGYVSETEKQFYESNLYIEQPLDNVYARSKFEAEKAVLDAMVDGLQANIMRMGNLTNRTDGKFQRNYESNAFLKRIKGVLDLGVFPDYLMDLYMEFTPIDEAANAIMTIARHFSNNQTVFHINSTKVLYFDKAIEYFNSLDCHLEVIGGTEFTDMLIQSAKDTGTEYIFETFINDMNDDNQLVYDSNIKIENNFTENYLRMLGFEWSNIGLDYIQKYVLYFRKLGYFGE
jgi:thioester reductase-like protein